MTTLARLACAAAAALLAPRSSAQITLTETFPVDHTVPVLATPDATLDLAPALPGILQNLTLDLGSWIEAAISGIAWVAPADTYWCRPSMRLDHASHSHAYDGEYDDHKDVPVGSNLWFQWIDAHFDLTWSLGPDGLLTLHHEDFGNDRIHDSSGTQDGTWVQFELRLLGTVEVTWQPDPLPYTVQCVNGATAEPYGSGERFYLHSAGLPADALCMWIQGHSSGAMGGLCIGGPYLRLKGSLGRSSPAGETTFHYATLPPPMSGSTLFFQLWHELSGGTGYGFSNGIAVTFP